MERRDTLVEEIGGACSAKCNRLRLFNIVKGVFSLPGSTAVNGTARR